MSQVPNGWTLAPLGDLADYVSRGRSPKYVATSDLPVVNQRCVRWEGVDESALKFVDPASRREWGEERLLRRGDILWNSTGTGTIGRAAIWMGSPRFDQVVADSHVTVVRSGRAVASSYLFSFIKSPVVQDRIDAMQAGSTNQVELVRAEVLAMEVPVPPLAEQRRIVAKLDDLTARTAKARAELDRVPTLAARYKQALLAAAFDGRMSTSNAQLRPVRWHVVSLDQGWSPKCDADPAADDEWGVVKTTSIQAMEFKAEENKRLPPGLTPRPAAEIAVGDVLITRAGPRSRVGIACAVRVTRKKLMICDKAYRLRVRDEVSTPIFLAYMLNAPQTLDLIEAMKSGINDSGLNLTQEKFLDLPIPAPTRDEQERLVQVLDSAFAEIERLAAEAAAARRLLDRLDHAILAKAFRGELVPQDPNDEPASALLERIRAERGGGPMPSRRGRRAKAA